MKERQPSFYSICRAVGRSKNMSTVWNTGNKLKNYKSWHPKAHNCFETPLGCWATTERANQRAAQNNYYYHLWGSQDMYFLKFYIPKRRWIWPVCWIEIFLQNHPYKVWFFVKCECPNSYSVYLVTLCCSQAPTALIWIFWFHLASFVWSCSLNLFTVSLQCQEIPQKLLLTFGVRSCLIFIKLYCAFQNSNNHDLGLQSDAAVKNCKKAIHFVAFTMYTLFVL